MIQRIGVIGCGIMGAGIAQLALQSGYNVIVREINEDFLNKGLSKIRKGIDKLCEKGAIKTEEKDNLLTKLKGTTSFDDLRDSDMIIEAVFEDIKIKSEVFMSLDHICKKETILRNTSHHYWRHVHPEKDQFIGSFFNPVSVMPLLRYHTILPTIKW